MLRVTLPTMERNRQGRRAGNQSGSGVVFAACHQRGRKASDEEDKMEETKELRAWERPKESLTTFRHSDISNKRNFRGMPQGTQPSGCDAEDAHEFTEAEKVAEDEDKPTPLPHFQKHGKSRVLAKEDKFVMDITAVPRKARSSLSSSSRLMSSGKPQGSRVPQQQSAVILRTTLSGSSSPNFSFSQNSRKRLKAVGTKFQASKNSQVLDFSTVSDQEAEVAEALFVLARSTPSHAGVLDSKLEAQLGMEAEFMPSSATSPFSTVITSTSRPNPASICIDKRGCVSSRAHDANGSFAEAPRRKRPRVVAEQKEEKVPMVGVVNSATMPSSSSSPSELVNSSVGETEPESVLQRAHSVAGEAHSFPFETSNSKVATGSPTSLPCWPHHIKEMKTGDLEGQCEQYAEAKVMKKEAQISVEMKERQPEVCLVEIRSIATQGNTVDNLVNHDEALTKPQLSSRSETVYDCDGCISNSKRDLMTSSATCKLEAVYGSGEGLSSHIRVKEDSAKGLNAGYGHLKLKERTAGGKEGSNQESEGQNEQILSETARGLQDGDIGKEEQSSQLNPSSKDNDTALSSTAASSHAPLGPPAGWMGGFAQLGHYGSAAPPWATRAPLPSLSLDTKATHPSTQLPLAAISSPVKRMKSCATHVYVAHYIHREQQVSRHSLWSAALYRATAYNLNTPPVNIVDNERPREAYADTTQKAQIYQSGPAFAYNISQSSVPRMAGSCSTHGGIVAGSTSASNRPTGAGGSTETSTVTASGHVMAAHAQYLQMMMQQGGFTSLPFSFNGPPGQAAQYFNAPFFPLHLMPQLPHLQASTQQAANVLPVQMQQQGKGASMHLIGSESITSSLMGQQKQQVQAALQLPSQSQQQPPMCSHDQASSLMATSAEKQISTSQQQTSASLSVGQKQHPISQNTFSTLGHQVKGLDHLFYSTPAVMGNSKQRPVGPGPLGLVSVAAMVATECHGVLPGTYEKGHNQQYQRKIRKAASGSENSITAKVQDCIKDKRVPMKQAGAPVSLSKANVDSSSPSFHGSTTGGSGPSSALSVNDVGLILRSAIVPGTQNCRSAPSMVAGQGPFLPNDSPKQVVDGAEFVLGANAAPTATTNRISDCTERNLPGNVSNFSGMMFPSSGILLPSSQSVKPSHEGLAKGGQSAIPAPALQEVSSSQVAKGQGYRAGSCTSGVPSTCPQMLSSASAPSHSSEAFSVCSLPLSVSKAAPYSASESPSNVKGAPALTKLEFSATKLSVDNPTPFTTVSSGQNVPVKAMTQHTSPTAAFVPKFSQKESSISAQQQRTRGCGQLQAQQGLHKLSSLQKSQSCLQQQQLQYVSHFSLQQQQQAVPSHSQLVLPHRYQQSLPSSPGEAHQHSHHDSQTSHLQQKQPEAVSSSPSLDVNNGLHASSSNLTSGATISGHMSSVSNGTDQLQVNTLKTAYSTESSLPSGEISEMRTTAHATVVAQVNSPCYSPARDLHHACTNPVECSQPLMDRVIQQDLSSA